MDSGLCDVACFVSLSLSYMEMVQTCWNESIAHQMHRIAMIINYNGMSHKSLEQAALVCLLG